MGSVRPIDRKHSDYDVHCLIEGIRHACDARTDQNKTLKRQPYRGNQHFFTG